MTPQIALTEARNTGATVSLVMADGSRLVGTVKRNKYDPALLRIVSPGTTWTTLFHPDDVVEVVFE